MRCATRFGAPLGALLLAAAACGDDGERTEGTGGASSGGATATSPAASTSSGPSASSGPGTGGGLPEGPAVTFFVDERPHDAGDEEVATRTARYTDPIRVVVSGLLAGSTVRVETTSGTSSSHARFVVGGDGSVDLAADRPLDGTWSEPDGDGFLWSLDGPAELDVTVAVIEDGGGAITSATLEREPFLAHVVAEVVDDGTLVGTFYRPEGEGPFPGVLVFGGSEGGRETGEFLAAYLATLGYAALGVAYFGEAGLPSDLTDVPLEILLGDLDALRARPEVDPDRIGLWGGSRGGELSLLLAALDPTLRAVIAEVPSGYVWGSAAQLDRAAWTLGGDEVAYIPSSGAFGESWVDEAGTHVATRSAFFEDIAQATDEELDLARAPIGDASAAFLFLAGGDDQLWPSCELSEVAMDTLIAAEHVSEHGDVLHCFPEAGHAIGLPGSSTFGLDEVFVPELDLWLVLGGTPQGTARAQRAANTAMRAFLERTLGAP